MLYFILVSWGTLWAFLGFHMWNTWFYLFAIHSVCNYHYQAGFVIILKHTCFPEILLPSVPTLCICRSFVKIWGRLIFTCSSDYPTRLYSFMEWCLGWERWTKMVGSSIIFKKRKKKTSFFIISLLLLIFYS